MNTKTKYLIKNIIRRIFFSKSNYVILFISYTLLSFILSDLFSKYLNNEGDINNLVVIPFFNTLNVIISFNFIFGFAEYLIIPRRKDNYKQINRLSMSEDFFQISNWCAALFYIIFIISPGFIIFLFLGIFKISFLKSLTFPFLTLVLLQLFLFSWMNLFACIFRNRNAVILLTFLIVGIFSFFNSISTSVENLFLSNLLREIGLVSHLELIFSGVLSLYDIFYLLSYPICISIILSIYSGEKLKGKYIYNGVGIIGAVLCFMLIIFIISKNNLTYDFSNKKIRTLSKETRSVLSQIEDEIRITVLSRANELKIIKNQFDPYLENSNKFKIDFINPDLRPDIVKKFKINKIPAVIFERERHFFNLYNFNEIDITSSLLNLSKKEMGRIAILDEVNKNGDFLKNLNERLRQSYYETNYIENIRQAQIFQKFIYLVDYDLDEKSKIELTDLIKSGKEIFILIPPNLNKRLQGWKVFLEEFEININNHFAVDQSKSINGSKGTVPYVLFSKLLNGEFFEKRIIFPLSPAITRTDRESINMISEFNILAESSEAESWGELNVGEINNGLNLGGGDIKGPVALAVHVKTQAGGKITLIGSQHFLNDQYVSVSSNIDYFLDMINSENNIQITQIVETNLSSVFKGQIKNNHFKFWNLMYLVPSFYLLLFFILRKKYV